MASNQLRLPQRRVLPQRVKVDENATRHVRQASGSGVPLPVQKATIGLKAPLQRVALVEVTATTVNQKENLARRAGKDKDEPAHKRPRSDSTSVAQRIPLGPNRAQVQLPVANTRLQRLQRPQLPTLTNQRRTLKVAIDPPIVEEEHLDVDIHDEMMDLEDNVDPPPTSDMFKDETEDEYHTDDDQDEVERMVVEHGLQELARKVPYVWPNMTPERAAHYQRRVEEVRAHFGDEEEEDDPTMVSEYASEIFQYMTELEQEILPLEKYQNRELTWDQRRELVDWLAGIHLHFRLLPETLWIAINIMDRFLSKRFVAGVKMQLVGVTAMLIAAKYEEIMAPSVEEFVICTDNGYSKDEILKGEKIILQALEFQVSHYCSPYTWMRRISKADDYDLQTRTLCKFLAEVTLLDERFLRVTPQLVAAVGMYASRVMMGDGWDHAFIYHSGFTEEQLITGYQHIVSILADPDFPRLRIYRKYAHKRFLKASTFAVSWARSKLSQRPVQQNTMMSADEIIIVRA